MSQTASFPIPMPVGSLESYIQAVRAFPVLSAEEEHDIGHAPQA